MIYDLEYSINVYLFSFLFVLATCAVFYARWHYGTLEKIKQLPVTIKPVFVGGSDIQIYKKLVHEQDDKNVQTYGKLFGFYEGREPQIYVADLQLIRKIFVKDFDHFQDKRIMDFGHELVNEMMDLLPYKKWKPIRSSLSPNLSSGKLRFMSEIMSEAIQDWMTIFNKINNENRGEFDPKNLFRSLTADVVARCGFGVKLNSLHDPNNILVQMMNMVFHEDHNKNFLSPFIQTFPFLMKLLPVIPPQALDYFHNLVKSTMDTRRANNFKIGDFVDTLNEMLTQVSSDPEYKTAGITKQTVMSQAMLFFVASFKNTTTALSFLAYNLAANPKKQDKLLEEIDSYLNRHNGKIMHDTLNELVYLTACMHESLRIFLPVIRLERVCTNNWRDNSTGLCIPKGMAIQVPIWSIHHNEEYHKDPEEFKPERFLAENKDKMNSYSYLSFGLGPHNCVGMRLAKEIILLSMVQFLQKFTLKLPKEMEGKKLEFYKGNTFLLAVKPFKLIAIKRI